MDFLGTVLIVIGVVISAVAYIMIVIEAFKTTIWWGLGTLFIQIVGIVYVIMYWEQTKKYVIWILYSFLFYIVGGILISMR